MNILFQWMKLWYSTPWNSSKTWDCRGGGVDSFLINGWRLQNVATNPCSFSWCVESGINSSKLEKIHRCCLVMFGESSIHQITWEKITDVFWWITHSSKLKEKNKDVFVMNPALIHQNFEVKIHGSLFDELAWIQFIKTLKKFGGAFCDESSLDSSQLEIFLLHSLQNKWHASSIQKPPKCPCRSQIFLPFWVKTC